MQSCRHLGVGCYSSISPPTLQSINHPQFTPCTKCYDRGHVLKREKPPRHHTESFSVWASRKFQSLHSSEPVKAAEMKCALGDYYVRT